MRVLKWIGIAVGAILLLLGVMFVFVYMSSESKINSTLNTPGDGITAASDSLAGSRGKHIAQSRGCVTCHGDDLAGKVFMENGAMGTIVSPNLTRSESGEKYSVIDWNAAVRYGIGKGGRPLFFMSSEDYYMMSDQDLADLVAYLNQLPAKENTLPENKYGPIFRMLVAFGAIKPANEKIDTGVPRTSMPEPGETVAYGKYLSAICASCHGQNMAGGKMKGKDPSWPNAANLTPHAEQGFLEQDKALFIRALREGISKSDRKLHEAMPRSLAYMTDKELNALWLYLQSLPPTETPAEK